MHETLAVELKTAWGCVQSDYSRGVLWYEADLVASLYYHLRRETPHQCVLNVDVRMPCRQFGPKRPDLVVSNDSDVLAVIEAKYYPWMSVSSPRADWRAAIDSLLLYGRCGDGRDVELSLRIDPHTAKTAGVKPKLTAKTWLVLAMVASASPTERESTRSEVHHRLSQRPGHGGLLHGFVDRNQYVFGADLWADEGGR